MSEFVETQLKANPNLQQIQVNIEPHILRIIAEYCRKSHYSKVKSTIQFPAPYNEFMMNVSLYEF